MGHSQFLLVDVEVKHITNLEAGPVIQHQVSTDEYVHIIRGRRRQHHFQFVRARLHSSAKPRRKRSIDNQLTLEPRRQPVALRESGRQMVIVRPVPTADVSIVIPITLVAPAVVLVMAIPVSVIAVVIVAVVPAIIVVTIMFVMPVSISLRHGHGR